MKKAYIYISLTILFWGTTATTSKLLVNNMSPLFALTYSFLFATIFLFFYLLSTKKLSMLKKIKIADFFGMSAIGSLGVLFYNIFLLLGTERLPAQEAFVINDLWPALIIIFSVFLLHEKLNLGKIIAIIFSLIGIIVVTTNGKLDGFAGQSITGITFCVLGAISYALYSVLSKKSTYDKTCAVFVAYSSGTVLAFILTCIFEKFYFPDLKSIGGMAWNGIICNGLPYLLWSYALAMGPTAIMANLAYLVPFVSLLCTHFVLGEPITRWSVLGLILIVLGIALQFFTDSFQKKLNMKKASIK